MQSHSDFLNKANNYYAEYQKLILLLETLLKELEEINHHIQGDSSSLELPPLDGWKYENRLINHLVGLSSEKNELLKKIIEQSSLFKVTYEKVQEVMKKIKEFKLTENLTSLVSSQMSQCRENADQLSKKAEENLALFKNKKNKELDEMKKRVDELDNRSKMAYARADKLTSDNRTLKQSYEKEKYYTVTLKKQEEKRMAEKDALQLKVDKLMKEREFQKKEIEHLKKNTKTLEDNFKKSKDHGADLKKSIEYFKAKDKKQKEKISELENQINNMKAEKEGTKKRKRTEGTEEEGIYGGKGIFEANSLHTRINEDAQKPIVPSLFSYGC